MPTVPWCSLHPLRGAAALHCFSKGQAASVQVALLFDFQSRPSTLEEPHALLISELCLQPPAASLFQQLLHSAGKSHGDRLLYALVSAVIC